MAKNNACNLVALLAFTSMLNGCMTAAKHQQSLHSTDEREMTVGLVQARIEKGMSGAEVAQVLGSPNIVTRDSSGDDTWIYDKIATEASYSHDSGGVVGLGGAGGQPASSLILGGLLSGYSRNAGAAATTQRTLTVVIRFDQRQRVKDFSYHASKF